jgi:FkbM family methyltransferase
MFQKIIQSFNRKIARRITKTYPTHIDSFNLESYGIVKFANWKNPLVTSKEISLKNVKFFKQFLNEGDLAIDIGANIGNMTLPMALAAGKQGIILAFDPNPFVFDILKINATLNTSLTTIHAYNYAITDHEGDFYYNSSEASFNNGGVSTEKNNKHGKFSLSQKIKGIELEKFLSESYLHKSIQLIKIDAEGYDKEIIKSIRSLIQVHKPVIITECFGKLSTNERYEQFELLNSLGYNLHYFSDFDIEGETIPILKKEDMCNWKHFDLYAIHA